MNYMLFEHGKLIYDVVLYIGDDFNHFHPLEIQDGRHFLGWDKEK